MGWDGMGWGQAGAVIRGSHPRKRTAAVLLSRLDIRRGWEVWAHPPGNQQQRSGENSKGIGKEAHSLATTTPNSVYRIRYIYFIIYTE